MRSIGKVATALGVLGAWSSLAPEAGAGCLFCHGPCHHGYYSKTVTYGYAPAVAAAPVAQGYGYPAATGYGYPAATGYGYGYPTGTGYGYPAPATNPYAFQGANPQGLNIGGMVNDLQTVSGAVGRILTHVSTVGQVPLTPSVGAAANTNPRPVIEVITHVGDPVTSQPTPDPALAKDLSELKAEVDALKADIAEIKAAVTRVK